MENATGKFVMFIDADDYIDNNYVENMYCNIRKSDTDVVCSGYTECEGSFIKEVKLDRKFIKGKKEWGEFMYKFNGENESYIPFVIWGKIYRRNSLENLKFNNLAYGEDTLFIAELCNKNINIQICDLLGYYYVRNSESATKTKGQSLITYNENMMDCYRKLCTMYYDVNVDIAKRYEHKIVDSIFSPKRYINNKKIYMELRKIALENIKQLKKIRKSCIKHRIYFKLYETCPNLLWILL